MKKIGVVILAVLCVGMTCLGFFFVKRNADSNQNKDVELTEVEKLITKDLSKNYPATPREVVKLYNRIITCYYEQDYTDEQLDQLADQAWCLFDEELQENNPKDQYLMSVELDIANYEQRERYIAQSDVCDSQDVLYKTIDGDEIAYVNASYFVREGSTYDKSYQQYVLRQDAQDRWKILVFYQIAEPSEEEE